MNRNLAGEWLSEAELVEIALRAEVITPERWIVMQADLHNENLRTSKLWELTRVERGLMFGRGELILDTRKEAS